MNATTTLNLFDELLPTAAVVKPRGVDLSFFKPELITKELKMSTMANGVRRIRLSSNFLPLMGFSPGVRTTVEDLGVNAGMKISFNPEGHTKVYSRTYTQRRNNPLEAMIDIQNQSVIARAIPTDAERLHFTLKNGSILIKPLFNNTFLIRNNIRKAENKFSSFVAMTGGVDAHCLQASGFTIQSILEYRPQEARDKNDLTETGALNALSNVPTTKYVFNEDISKINWQNVKQVIQNDDPIGLLHVSLACDDFSTSKGVNLKKRSVENLDTSADLVYDALRLVETTQPATVLIENVPPFASSAAGDLLRVKLRKWGYYVTDAILDPREQGGLTSRRRYYLVASVWPGFEMPEAMAPNASSIWRVIESHLHECRDITHTSTVHLGVETGRARVITSSSTCSPSILKSQARQSKDSVTILSGGRYYLPSEKLLRVLNGFPDDLNLDSVSATLASEIIGQSIDYPMHHRLTSKLKEHISRNV